MKVVEVFVFSCAASTPPMKFGFRENKKQMQISDNRFIFIKRNKTQHPQYED
jgi:hypothetical protein